MAVVQDQPRSAEETEQVAEQYRRLDSLFVEADVGNVSAAHEAILAQYIIQNDVQFAVVATSYVSAAVSFCRCTLTT